jgi:transcription termination/antitermination protein NusA
VAKIKYTVDDMKFISVFENVTKAKVKDCVITNNNVLFIVHPDEIGKAVGKKGVNVHTLERILKKKIRIVEFAPLCADFIENLVFPSKIKQVTEADGIVIIQPQDLKTRGQLIGRNASTLRGFEAIVKRYFPIKELKVANG